MYQKLANEYVVNTEPNALEKFHETAKQVELKQSDDISGEVEDVKNVHERSTTKCVEVGYKTTHNHNDGFGNQDFLK